MPYEIKQRMAQDYCRKMNADEGDYCPGREASGTYKTIDRARKALIAEIRDSCCGENDTDFDPWAEDPPSFHPDTGSIQFHVAKAIASKAVVDQVITVNDFSHKIVRVK